MFDVAVRLEERELRWGCDDDAKLLSETSQLHDELTRLLSDKTETVVWIDLQGGSCQMKSRQPPTRETTYIIIVNAWSGNDMSHVIQSDRVTQKEVTHPSSNGSSWPPCPQLKLVSIRSLWNCDMTIAHSSLTIPRVHREHLKK